MSIGMGAFANEIFADDKIIIYEYGSYNLNDLQYGNEEHICDGRIIIQKCCLVEPIIHEKIKKMPSGRRKLYIRFFITPFDK